jgi:IS5 family transposase
VLRHRPVFLRRVFLAGWENWLEALWCKGIEALMLRTRNDQPTLWESILPPEVLRLPAELARVDALLDDERFFAPFRAYFDLTFGRPSIPAETYQRLMFLKVRYRLGYESLCAEVTDSIGWRLFCRIGIDGRVPHPSTLMKITTRCGSTAIDQTQRRVAGQSRRGQAAAGRTGPGRHHRGVGQRATTNRLVVVLELRP